MTRDYSRVSDTARAIDLFVLPGMLAHVERTRQHIAAMPADRPFVIADYGAADGANSGHLFERVAARLREINPSLPIRLVYIDIAEPGPFYEFWGQSPLSGMEDVEATYIRRSFYAPFPELAGRVNIGYSSTAMHWLDTESVDAGFFRHPRCVQPNQLSGAEVQRFAGKWRDDWRIFFLERARELAGGGLLFLACLTNLGGDRWPASAGYGYLRDACASLSREGRISREELEAIFIPDYFAAPEEMRDLIDEECVRRNFSVLFFDAMTVPCAYSSRMHDAIEDPAMRRHVADILAQVVRAWSESSVRTGLSIDNAKVVDEIYERLADRFCRAPRGLPYQYCLMELVRRDDSHR